MIKFPSRPERLDRAWRDWAGRDQINTATSPMLKTTYSVSDFIAWQRDGSLQLKPPFQRNSVWSPGAKSYFIDTIIKDLPTPLILLRERRSDLKDFKPMRQVVDGQQRLRTVISFVAPAVLGDATERDSFVIKEEHNKSLANKSFQDLPDEIKSKILDYQFSVNAFSADTDDRVIIQLFSRLNATGYKLNKQELRNAEWTGRFKSLATDLSAEQLNRWRSWDVFTSDNLARMADIELTSELMIFIIRGITEKSDPTITKAYSDYDVKFPASQVVAKRFRHVFQVIDDSLLEVVQKHFNTRTKFYAIFTAIYDIVYGIQSELKTGPAKPLTSLAIAGLRRAGELISEVQAPIEVLTAIKRTPSHARERKTLVNYLIRMAA